MSTTPPRRASPPTTPVASPPGTFGSPTATASPLLASPGPSTPKRLPKSPSSQPSNSSHAHGEWEDESDDRSSVATPLRRRAKAKERTLTPKKGRTPIRSAPLAPVRVKKAPPPESGIASTSLLVLRTVLSAVLRVVRLLLFAFRTLDILLLHIPSMVLVGLPVLSTLVYLVVPYLPTFLRYTLAAGFRRVAPALLPSFALPDLSALSDPEAVRRVVAVPGMALASATCWLANVQCEHSLVDNGRPFWWSDSGPRVDVGRVARELSKEVQQTRDIFDSVRVLGDGSMASRLEYVKLWEIATAVEVSSSLEERLILGNQIAELGNMARDLSDQVKHIDSKAISGFTWIANDFTSLHALIAPPPSSDSSTALAPITNATLASRLDRLISQLDSVLGALFELTSQTTDLALRTSEHGQELLRRLHLVHANLQREKDEQPIWKHALAEGKHLWAGGSPPRVRLLQRDLRLTGETIESVNDVRRHVEDLRGKVKVYRDQVAMSRAAVLGFHEGAEVAGVDGQEEVRVLGQLVGGLVQAVGEAKGARVAGGYKRIDA